MDDMPRLIGVVLGKLAIVAIICGIVWSIRRIKNGPSPKSIKSAHQATRNAAIMETAITMARNVAKYGVMVVLILYVAGSLIEGIVSYSHSQYSYRGLFSWCWVSLANNFVGACIIGMMACIPYSLCWIAGRLVQGPRSKPMGPPKGLPK